MMINKINKFYLLIAGKFISDTAMYFDLVALNVFVYQITKSPMQTSFFLIARLAGSAICGMYSGVLSDRINRKKLMILSDLIRGLALLILFLCPQEYQLWCLYAVGLTLGAFNSVFIVALNAAIPAIVGPEQKLRGNAILNSTNSISMVLGCTGAGVILGLVSYRIVFLIDACTYFLSALNLFFLKLQTNEFTKKDLKSDFWSVLPVIRGMPVLGWMLLIRLSDAFGSSSQVSAMPIFSNMMNSSRPSFWIGIMYATWAFGKLTASKLMVSVKSFSIDGYAESVFVYGTILMSASFILLFSTKIIWLVVVASIVSGIADGVTEIAYTTRLQEVSDLVRGKIFGVSSALHAFGMGFGLLFCGPLLEVLSPFGVASIFHGIPMFLCSWLLLKKIINTLKTPKVIHKVFVSDEAQNS